MKPKTIALLLCFLFIIIFLAFFLPQNRELLQGRLHVFSFSFSVIAAMVFTMFLSILVPSAYFSGKYLALHKQSKQIKNDHLKNDKQRIQLQKALRLWQHGLIQEAHDLLDPLNFDEALLLKMQCRWKLGETQTLIAPLRHHFSETKEPAPGYFLAERLTELGESPLEVLRQIIADQPREAKRAFQLMLAHFDGQEQWDECKKTAAEMARQGWPVTDETAAAYKYQWLLSQEDQREKKVLEGYQLLIKQNPKFVPAHLALGDTYLEDGTVEKAFTVYEKGFEKTNNPVFLDRLETFYLELGRPEDAIQVYRELKIKNESILVNFQLAKLYFKLEMLDESFAILEPLKSRLNQIPGFHYYFTEIMARRNRYPEALADYRQFYQDHGFAGHDFICTVCQTTYETWQARCGQCRQWNGITLEVGLVQSEIPTTTPIVY